jgi:hypothetical protein
VRWTRLFDASEFVMVRALAIDPGDGGIAVAGSFAGDVKAGAPPMSSAGAHDVLVARLDRRGVVQWSRRAGGPYPDYAFGVAALAGEVAAVGAFGVEANFGNGMTLKGTKRSLDGWIALYGRDGAPRWVRAAGGPGTDRATAVIMDPKRVCHAGTFMGEGRFGGPPLRARRTDIYVACLDHRGKHQWSIALRGEGDEQVRAMTARGDALAIAGDFAGPLRVGQRTLDSAGKHDVFVAVIRARGTALSARSIGGGKEESAGALAAHPRHGWIVGGSFSGTPGLAGIPLTAEAAVNGFVLATGL